MSIIEKAVEKLERRKTSAGLGPDAGNRNEGDTIEKVVSASAVLYDAKGENETAEAVFVETTGSPVQSRPEHRHAPRSSAVPPPVIELPYAELSKRGMLTPITPRSNIAEEFRTIKRPLLRNIDKPATGKVDNANLVMVTSALQGDGKTFTAINLAISIAMEQDKTVLFVDADVAKASAGALLGVPANSLGLINVLENNDMSLSDVILPTSMENLRILPAGTIHERSNELLASRSMQDLMRELAGRYPDRVVVFDSPPMLLTTEASVLASFMGQIVFVVSTDETPQQAVTEALERVGQDKVIGMVLNKSHRRRNQILGLAYGYGYRSGYGYGYGYGYGRQGREPATTDGTA